MHPASRTLPPGRRYQPEPRGALRERPRYDRRGDSSCVPRPATSGPGRHACVGGRRHRERGLRRAPRPGRSTRARASGSADLGDGPLQLPMHLLHAGRGLRPRLRIPPPFGGPHLRGDPTGGRDCRGARSPEAPDHRRRAAGPARLARPHRDARRAAHARRGAGGPDAHDERLGARSSRPAPRRGGARTDHGLARFARRRDLPADERCRLPGLARPRRDRTRPATPASPRSRSTWS